MAMAALAAAVADATSRSRAASSARTDSTQPSRDLGTERPSPESALRAARSASTGSLFLEPRGPSSESLRASPAP